MSDPCQVTVTLGWALWSKHPGTDRDYSVLDSSAEPFSGPEFASVLRHFMPGTPSTERDRPDSLPWVTISRVRVEEQTYLGIAIMDRDPAGQVDVARRPITRTSYFCVQYLETPEARLSYYSLYQKLAELELPHSTSERIQLEVPSLDPGRAAADIRLFSEQAVMAAAALLLAGPVSIIGSEKTGLRLEDRLRFLDAVAALLPYGYRTVYTAATWSDSSARPPIRMAFAARPRQDAGVIRWGTVPGAASGVSEEYERLIRQVIDRPADEQLSCDPDPLTALIRHLADDTAPYGFDRPQDACASVRRFGLPFIVWDEVRAGKATIADVWGVFRQRRITELPWAGRRALLLRLFFSGEPDDWDLIREWRVPAVGDDPSVLLDLLSEACRGHIWTAAPSRASKATEYLRMANDNDLLDALLARLAVAPASRDDLIGGLRAAVQAIANGLSDIQDRTAFPLTRAALEHSPLAACELLAHLAGADVFLPGTVSWLLSVMPDFLAPFSIVLRPARVEVDLGQIRQLAACDEECVRALMDTASRKGRLDRVLPWFAIWRGLAMLEPAGNHRPAAANWQRLAASLDPSGIRFVEVQAWLDIVLLICENRPRFLREQRDSRAWKRYNGCFAEAWNTLIYRLDLGQAGDEQLTRILARYLEDSAATATPGELAAIEDLAVRLADGGGRPRLDQIAEKIRPHLLAARRWRSGRESPEQETADWWGAQERQGSPVWQEVPEHPGAPDRQPAHEPREAPERLVAPDQRPRYEAQETREYPIAPDQRPTHGAQETPEHAVAPDQRPAQERPEVPVRQEASERPEEPDQRPAPDHGQRSGPGEGHEEILAAIRGIEPGGRLEGITRPCLDALRSQVHPQAVGLALAESGAIQSGTVAAQAIRRLWYSVSFSPDINGPEAEEWLHLLALCFADEEMFDPQVARDFAAADIQQKVSDIVFSLHGLQVLPSEQWQPRLPDLEKEFAELSRPQPDGDGDPADPERRHGKWSPWRRNTEKKGRHREGQPS